ncbi:MAG TPA: hypothetical protein PLS44_01885 [Candidatus Cloacimonas sp.]|nr:hypothetical protein [Candidatus Cloacimonas sp.]
MLSWHLIRPLEIRFPHRLLWLTKTSTLRFFIFAGLKTVVNMYRSYELFCGLSLIAIRRFENRR